jgi:hypothetical protein
MATLNFPPPRACSLHSLPPDCVRPDSGGCDRTTASANCAEASASTTANRRSNASEIERAEATGLGEENAQQFGP